MPRVTACLGGRWRSLAPRRVADLSVPALALILFSRYFHILMPALKKIPEETIEDLVKTNVVRLPADITVGEALANVKRDISDEGGVLYFYVIDSQQRLIGVLPTRKLLTAPNEQILRTIAVPSVVALTRRTTVAEACEMFLKHKYLAFPVVDGDFKLVGTIDVSMFAEEIVDLTERKKADDVFEMLGFRMSQLKKATAFETWRYRFPWLLTTIASGTVCALLAGMFEHTLSRSIVLAFFMTLVLALGESVSIQAMSVTIQRLRFVRPTLPWFFRTAISDALSASLIAGSCAVIVFLIILLWKGTPVPAMVIGSSIFLALMGAAILGLTVPSILHSLRLDPKVAAGPVTLSITDAYTILVYFLLGNAFL